MSKKRNQLIDNYLSNSLSIEEQKEIEELKKTDLELVNDIENTRLANVAIHNLGLMGTSLKLDKIHKNKKTNSRVKTALAGTFLISSIAVGLYLNTTTTQTISRPIIKKELPFIKPKEKIKTVPKDNIIPIRSDSSTKENITFPPQPIVVDNKGPKTLITDTTTGTSALPKIVAIQDSTPIIKEEKSIIEIRKAIHKKAPCPIITLINLNTTPACIGKSNGQINITDKNIQNGTAPFSIKVLDQDDTEVRTTDLIAGRYNVSVTDSKQCDSKYLPVEI